MRFTQLPSTWLAAIDSAHGGKNALKRLIAPMDPITYADQLKARNLLILAASRDDVLPPSGAKALWEAMAEIGKTPTKLVDASGTHTSPPQN